MRLRPIYRVTTFVPLVQLEDLLRGVEALDSTAGATYDRLVWWSEAVEQFRPLPGATPVHGEIGRVERVATLRVEFSIPRDPALLQGFLTRLTEHHPWEQPTIFVDESMAPLEEAPN